MPPQVAELTQNDAVWSRLPGDHLRASLEQLGQIHAAPIVEPSLDLALDISDADIPPRRQTRPNMPVEHHRGTSGAPTPDELEIKFSGEARVTSLPRLINL